MVANNNNIMDNNFLKQIEENTRRTAKYLGFFVILTIASFTMALVAVIANFA